MVKILLALIIGIIIIIALIRLKIFVIKKINEYIDNRFEEEFYNRTNWFIRLFISKKKKEKIEHEETDDYREKVNKANKIANIILTILIIILVGILVYYVYIKNLFYLSMNVRLPAALHANLLAMGLNHTAGTVGAYGAAEVLAVEYQQSV